ncbi:UNVERIFIED_CONTAM: tyrosine-type recombinase/integrase [Microbacterium sp. SLM126]
MTTSGARRWGAHPGVAGSSRAGVADRSATSAIPTFRTVWDSSAGRHAEDLVFPARDGGYMKRVRNSRGSKSWFASALNLAQLPPMTIHDLRHTAASLAVQSGAHVKTIQRMLGHTSAAMTLDVYSDPFDHDLDAVSNALDAAARRSAEARRARPPEEPGFGLR